MGMKVKMLMSQFVKFIKRLMFIRNIFGYYFFFGNNRFTETFSATSCFILSLFYLIIFFNHIIDSKLYIKMYTIEIVEYVINVIISLILKGHYIKKLLSVLTLTGGILHAKTIKISWKLFFLLTLILVGLLCGYVGCTDLQFYTVANFTRLALIITEYLDFITKFLVFYALYLRMKLLKQKFEDNCVTISVIGEDKYMINNIKKYLSVYDLLLGFIKNIDYEIEIWVSEYRYIY